MVVAGSSPTIDTNACAERVNVDVIRYVPAGMKSTGECPCVPSMSSARCSAAVSSVVPSPTAPYVVFALSQLSNGPVNSGGSGGSVWHAVAYRLSCASPPSIDASIAGIADGPHAVASAARVDNSAAPASRQRARCPGSRTFVIACRSMRRKHMHHTQT